MLSEQWDTSAEVRLNVAVGPPAGPPLLLLHGVTRRWQDYLTLLPTLALRWELLALDLRGHGRSDRGPRYFVADYVRDVAALVRARFTEPGVIFGHSLGALIAAAVAAQEPERVKAVILEDPPGEPFVAGIRETPSLALYEGMRELAGRDLPLTEAAQRLGRIPFSPQRGGVMLPLSHFRDVTSLRFRARCLRALDPAVLTPLVAGRWLEGTDLDAIYRAIRCPALLLAADEEVGGLLSKFEAERIAALMSDCCHIHLPRVGHLVHWSQPDTTLRLATGFLESVA
jgi:pimeloyl-ACP methyl ester carboxylesterase